MERGLFHTYCSPKKAVRCKSVELYESESAVLCNLPPNTTWELMPATEQNNPPEYAAHSCFARLAVSPKIAECQQRDDHF